MGNTRREEEVGLVAMKEGCLFQPFSLFYFARHCQIIEDSVVGCVVI